MITFQEGTYDNTILHRDFNSLLEENWGETGMLNSAYKLAPKLDMYRVLYERSILRLYSVNDAESLIGYFIAVVVPHPHFENVVTAETDTFFVSKKFRKGLLGYKFLQYAINKLKKEVQLIFLTTNTKRNLSNLLYRLDFKLVDYKFVLEV